MRCTRSEVKEGYYKQEKTHFLISSNDAWLFSPTSNAWIMGEKQPMELMYWDEVSHLEPDEWSWKMKRLYCHTSHVGLASAYVSFLQAYSIPQPISTFSTHSQFKFLPQPLLGCGVHGKVPEHPCEHVAKGSHHETDHIWHNLNTMTPGEINFIPTKVHVIVFYEVKTEG